MDKNLELKLKDADILVMVIDMAISQRTLSSRSPIADARLSYGEPGRYEHLSEREIAIYKEKFSKPS